MNMLLLAVLPLLQTLLDRALRADAAAHRRLRSMGDNRLLRISSTSAPGWQLLLRSELGADTPRLRLHSASADIADASISGTNRALLGLLLGDARQQLHQPGIQLSGDSELAAEMQALLGGLDIDWEDRLAALLGELPGYQLNRGLRAVGSAATQGRQRISDNLRDYLHEESALLPRREQVTAAREALLDQRLQLDRLEARLALRLTEN